ncbi:MAG: hypothetical protein OQK55_09970 [Thermoanaerobaculales bacterium]|nr:hypothetical protein [Thermoanaerobaculales bacterium]
MEESRTQRLHELLRRLGKALHATVVRSDEVRQCLEELHEDGWQAVMMLETSLVCGEDGSVEVGRGTMRLHVGEGSSTPEYRIGVDDARFLSSIGISFGRHRSPSKCLPRPQSEPDSESKT